MEEADGLGEGLLSALAEFLRQDSGDTSLETLVQVMLAENPHQRITLARQVLQQNPDRPHAYLILAEETPSLQEKFELYSQAISAFEKVFASAKNQEEQNFLTRMLQESYLEAKCNYALLALDLDQIETATQTA
ncbi:hypothetical protein [Caldalkalibacillus uzonensis]|nr:hypothetical protein [Caldalkalibacillus uzonensis]